jgi:hypothetical protein
LKASSDSNQEFYKPHYRNIFAKYEYDGEKWSEVSKVFQAKIMVFRPKYIEKFSREFKRKIENFPSPMVLRRTYLYLKLHSSSNKKARKINITQNDFFAHVDTSYLKK